MFFAIHTLCRNFDGTERSADRPLVCMFGRDDGIIFHIEVKTPYVLCPMC